MSAFLYGLYDTRKDGASAPFYVGVGVKNRHLRHWNEFVHQGFAVNPRVKRVFERHLRDGKTPMAQILAICPNDREYLAIIERNAIKAYGRNWHPDERGSLCNNAIGGNGSNTIDMADPEIRKNISEGVKKAHANDPTIKERMSVISKERWSNPEFRAAQSGKTTVANHKTWADEKVRESRIAGMKGVKKTLTEEALKARRLNLEKGRTEESRLVNGEKHKALWADPEYRAKQSASRSAAQKGKPISAKKMASNAANAAKARAAKKCAQGNLNQHLLKEVS